MVRVGEKFQASHREAELGIIKHPTQPGEDVIEKGYQRQEGNDVGNNAGHYSHSTRCTLRHGFQDIPTVSEETSCLAYLALSRWSN